MSIAVVVDKNNTVVTQITQTTTVVEEPKGRVVVTGIMGPPGASGSLNAMADVDTTNLTTGSLLVYNTGVQRWQSTTTLEDQFLNGGAF